MAILIRGILAGLRQLGYAAPVFTVDRADAPHLHKVCLSGKYFGVWDDIKLTFVD